MDYIIPNKKLFDAIYSYIDLNIKNDNVDWTYADDSEFDEGYDENLIEFRGDSWDDYGEYMVYIKKEYYEYESDGGRRDMKKKWSDKAPILEFKRYHPFWGQLQDIFGDLWKPVAKVWFETNYPKFPVKTYIFQGKDSE